MKTFYLKTLGCKVNQSDSNEIMERFFKSGWVQNNGDRPADVYIVNTCCVTQSADRKSRAAIRDAVRKKGDALVCVAGCYATRKKRSIEDTGGVDAVFGNDNRERLWEWIDGISAQTRPEGPNAGEPQYTNRTRAFLKVQDGCDNRCSFCIVPYVRGRSRSKDITSAVKEARALVEDGFREIVVTGVNLGSFGRDLDAGIDLIAVIDELHRIKGLERIRLSSIEASDVTDRLIDRMAASEKLMPHLHIPFQSGDDRVLGLMNKKLKAGEYLSIVERAKNKIKDLAITCDIIVGFPGESEEGFINTYDFIRRIAPSRVHIFTYSSRFCKSVLEQERQAPVPEATIKERFRRLKDLTDRLSNDFKASYLEKHLNVLFEEKKAGFWQGYSQNYIKVRAASDMFLKNAIIKVRIIGVSNGSCFGSLEKINLFP